MKKYREYMDGVSASDTLHQRLLGLDGSQKRPVQWKKYGALAAALLLVGGLGAWGMAHGGWNALAAGFRPAATTVPETADEPVPDIALVEPGEAAEPGKKTLGGYEVTDGVMTSYYILPYIDYGPPPSTIMESLLAAPDGGEREVTRDEVLALVGGEDALTAHLNWEEHQLCGRVEFEADGTVWIMFLRGEGEDTAFNLELSPGRMPPTCCVVEGQERTITDVWGVEVSGVNSAGSYGDVERGIYMDVSREVEFIANGVGCRLTAYGTQDEAVEELVSRFVRWAVLEGLDLSGISPDGVKPVEADPNYSVGEPNWNDSGEGEIPEFVPDYDPAYEDGVPAQDGTPVTETCPSCGAAYPAGSEHDCAATYTCEVCGQTCRMGQAHSHEICGYPLAPDTRICETCGETIPAGMNHDCAMCDGYPAPRVCEICGESYTAGTAHTCRQGGHHQEQHHGGHH